MYLFYPFFLFFFIFSLNAETYEGHRKSTSKSKRKYSKNFEQERPNLADECDNLNANNCQCANYLLSLRVQVQQPLLPIPSINGKAFIPFDSAEFSSVCVLPNFPLGLPRGRLNICVPGDYTIERGQLIIQNLSGTPFNLFLQLPDLSTISLGRVGAFDIGNFFISSVDFSVTATDNCAQQYLIYFGQSDNVQNNFSFLVMPGSNLIINGQISSATCPAQDCCECSNL